MLTIHHLSVSQSERIIWLCEELGVPYILRHYQRDAVDGSAPPEYRALHPFGLAPVVTVDGRVLGESGAIIDYLIARHGGGRLALPTDSEWFGDYLYWFHYANASFQPNAVMAFALEALGDAADGKLRHLKERRERSYALAEQWLAGSAYFGGPQFSAADIMMVFNLTTLRKLAHFDISAYPNIRRYLGVIGRRPAYARSMALADPGQSPLLD